MISNYDNAIDHQTLSESSIRELEQFWAIQKSGAFDLRKAGFSGVNSQITIIDTEFGGNIGEVGHGTKISQFINHVVPEAALQRMRVYGTMDLHSLLEDAIRTNAHVVNLSISTRIGWQRDDMHVMQPLLEKIQLLLPQAEEKGVILVAAAARKGREINESFGQYSGPILVGGITKDGILIDSNDPERIDIYAPAEFKIKYDGRNESMTESHSASAAYVSAACGAIASVVGHDNRSVRAILLNTASEINGIRILNMHAISEELVRLTVK